MDTFFSISGYHANRPEWLQIFNLTLSSFTSFLPHHEKENHREKNKAKLTTEKSEMMLKRMYHVMIVGETLKLETRLRPSTFKNKYLFPAMLLFECMISYLFFYFRVHKEKKTNSNMRCRVDVA